MYYPHPAVASQPAQQSLSDPDAEENGGLFAGTVPDAATKGGFFPGTDPDQPNMSVTTTSACPPMLSKISRLRCAKRKDYLHAML